MKNNVLNNLMTQVPRNKTKIAGNLHNTYYIYIIT